MSQTKAVIFDIGNVLIEWQPEKFYDRHYGVDARRRLFAEVDLHGMNDRIDRGAPFRDTVYEWADRYAEWTPHIRHWHDDWTDLATPVIDHSLSLLRALRSRGVPVFALTNFGIGSFEVAERKYPFLAEFDRRYISGHMQVIKPEPEIYRLVEEDCRIAPEGLLFTDDRAENIEAAAARGWQVHLFDGPEGWARRLVGAGLLTAREAGLT